MSDEFGAHIEQLARKKQFSVHFSQSYRFLKKYFFGLKAWNFLLIPDSILSTGNIFHGPVLPSILPHSVGQDIR